MIDVTDGRQHWVEVWAAKRADETSWFQETPEPCSRLIRSVSTPTSRVAIVGVGASRLVADLLAHGYRWIEAIDIAEPALRRLRAELGADADRVRFRQADARTLGFDEPVGVWHDRATFHFLVDPEDRADYVASAVDAVAEGGHALVAAFAPDGPEQCSGLPVRRYSAGELAVEFSSGFELVDCVEHEHLTPWGSPQRFVHAVLCRTGRSLNK